MRRALLALSIFAAAASAPTCGEDRQEWQPITVNGVACYGRISPDFIAECGPNLRYHRASGDSVLRYDAHPLAMPCAVVNATYRITGEWPQGRWHVTVECQE